MNINEYLSEKQVIDILNNYLTFKDINHCQKVADFSVILVESLSPILKISKEDKTLLYYSSLLHDIGRSIDKTKHHIHSKNIILTHSYFDVLPHNLRENLASLCYSHRKFLDRDILNYSSKNKKTALKLISLLRMADSLDHSHKYNISLNKVDFNEDTLFLFLQGEEVENILEKLNQKSQLFSDFFHMGVKAEV